MRPTYKRTPMRPFSSEDQEQEAVIEWARLSQGRYPELKLLHHIPNEGKRSLQTAGRLKSLGMLAGVPDLHLPVPRGAYCGLFIEMKYDKGIVTTEQKDYLIRAAEEGNYCCICYTAEDAITAITEYINKTPYNPFMLWPNTAILNVGYKRVLKDEESCRGEQP